MLAIYMVFFVLYNIGVLPTIMSILLPIPLIIYSVATQKIRDVIWLLLGCFVGTFLMGSSLWVSYNFKLWCHRSCYWNWNRQEVAILATSFKCGNCIGYIISDYNLCADWIKCPRINEASDR